MANKTADSCGDHSVLLRTCGLKLKEASSVLNMEFREGEIVGVAGLEGHGQDEFLRSLCGLHIPHAGYVQRILSDGSCAKVTSLWRAAKADIYYLPRERKTQGIFPGLTITDNYVMSVLSKKRPFGFIRKKAVRGELEKYREQLCITYASVNSPISSLSGGNQQKVLLSRLMACKPKIVLLNDPTRGVDIMTKDVLYGFFTSLAKTERIALILLSTEIEEILQICDRTLVFHSGDLFCELQRSAMSRASVIAAMFGRKS